MCPSSAGRVATRSGNKQATAAQRSASRSREKKNARGRAKQEPPQPREGSFPTTGTQMSITPCLASSLANEIDFSRSRMNNQYNTAQSRRSQWLSTRGRFSILASYPLSRGYPGLRISTIYTVSRRKAERVLFRCSTFHRLHVNL